jgi:hypothetical protein
MDGTCRALSRRYRCGLALLLLLLIKLKLEPFVALIVGSDELVGHLDLDPVADAGHART